MKVENEIVQRQTPVGRSAQTFGRTQVFLQQQQHLRLAAAALVELARYLPAPVARPQPHNPHGPVHQRLHDADIDMVSTTKKKKPATVPSAVHIRFAGTLLMPKQKPLDGHVPFARWACLFTKRSMRWTASKLVERGVLVHSGNFLTTVAIRFRRCSLHCLLALLCSSATILAGCSFR